MRFSGRVAVVTGAASGIGQAVAIELANRGVKAIALVDRSDNVVEVARSINENSEHPVAEPMIGDTSDASFRQQVYDLMTARHGVPSICIPAAGITRDQIAVKVDPQTGKAVIYPVEQFRLVMEVNLVAPVYWAMEMIARIAEQRRRNGLKRWEPEEGVQGSVVFIGSVSSQGNVGQVSYASTKAGLDGAQATLSQEAIYHGVRCAIIHPGFTNTPMVRALGEEYIKKNVLPYSRLRRLIEPREIADAICFLVSNSAVSGQLWADAGWHSPG
ncbi:MAG: 3-oxoacyl-[acyl-carrier protein] reductase [Chloroflexota bacterium]|jgi:NAD(P)-dependent dehydrogenase (short-subunit alcohol dehydrogenase family)|nr:3-oxoacyl-[acyl-carrier protein] reductase [Chloroflexota bacterium]